MDSRETVTIEETLLTQMFESEVPLNVLQRNSVPTQGEVVAESEGLQKRPRKAGGEDRPGRRTEGRA